MLTCGLCGAEQDSRGPGVASNREGTGSWTHSWVPFIEDLRGVPSRLVHPKCFVDEQGFDSLIALITDHDQRMRIELSKHW